MPNEHVDEPGKLCLPCARRQLAGKPARPCASCMTLNIDPLAEVRARAARPARYGAYAAGLALQAAGVACLLVAPQIIRRGGL